MRARMQPARALKALAVVIVVAVFAAALGGAFLSAAAAAQQAKKAEKAKEKEAEKKPEEEKKEGGGLFGGTKRVTGVGRTEEQRASVATGAKGAKPISTEAAQRAPSSTDRSRVATMEATRPTKDDMAAFFKEGNLNPKKGGS